MIAADGRDSGSARARHRGPALELRAEGAGVHRRPRLPHDGLSTEIHRSGGPFTLVPLPDRDGAHHSAVVWMERGPRAAELAALAPAAFEAALNARACGVLGALRLASPRRLWPIVAQVADRLDGPRTALAAEAAHVVPPIGAQGLNMSLADIALLLALCRRHRGGDIGAPALLRRYHRRRHPAILARVLGIDALNRAAMAEAPVLRDLRRAGLRLLHDLAPLRRGGDAARPRGRIRPSRVGEIRV